MCEGWFAQMSYQDFEKFAGKSVAGLLEVWACQETYRMLQNAYPDRCPSLASVRGLHYTHHTQCVFVRGQANLCVGGCMWGGGINLCCMWGGGINLCLPAGNFRQLI